MRYDTEVFVRRLSCQELLTRYREEQSFYAGCQGCPSYGTVWSCPPSLPDIGGYLEPYEQVYIIAVKVLYPEAVRRQVRNGTEAEAIRQRSYEPVKQKLLMSLLALEEALQKGKCLGAGQCMICERCTRASGKPCRYPEKRRYSITGFGFNMTKVLQELFQIPLLWEADGLPDYDMAVAMFAV